jgi:DNA invertase Pin-like site-specific DNA recombinase
MAHIPASVAQFETEVRAERVIAGQAKAKAEGKTWGGSEKGRRLKVTDEQVTLIRRLRREGESVSAIARATNLTRPTVYSYLPS